MPYGDKKSYSFFKMKGSPHKMGAIEGTSAFKKKRPINKSEDFDLDYTTDVTVGNKKLIEEFKAGKITKKQLEKEIREIKSYGDI